MGRLEGQAAAARLLKHHLRPPLPNAFRAIDRPGHTSLGLQAIQPAIDHAPLPAKLGIAWAKHGIGNGHDLACETCFFGKARKERSLGLSEIGRQADLDRRLVCQAHQSGFESFADVDKGLLFDCARNDSLCQCYGKMLTDAGKPVQRLFECYILRFQLALDRGKEVAPTLLDIARKRCAQCSLYLERCDTPGIIDSFGQICSGVSMLELRVPLLASRRAS